ncbi:MAG: diiron oxygenase [Dehalococcoidia bacterium]
MPDYTYAKSLENAYKVNWRIEDVLGNRKFDTSRPWLPAQLSGAAAISCLNDDEKMKLTHIEMGAYANLFRFVEEFITPTMVNLAQAAELQEGDAFDALTNFAAEEVKHMALFRVVRSLVDEAIGFPLALLDNEREIASVVLSKNLGGVLLLIEAIEWFTQLHYLSGFKDEETLDPLTRAVFKAHWQEEAQHAHLDDLEIRRVFGTMTDADKDEAIDDLIELVGAVDGLLQEQVKRDVENLQRYLDRTFTESENDEVASNVLRAKRYAFIESGVTHKNFLETFTSVTTPQQQEKVQTALGALLSS